MKEVTVVGQTVEEALQSALKQLQATEEQVEIDILDEGKKGILGLFGRRPASLKVRMKADPIREAKSYILSIAAHLGVHPDIQVKRQGKKVFFSLSGEKIALLIGKRGQTLNALQQLTQLVINRHSNDFIQFQLDAGDYRKKREETLTALAKRMAEKVETAGKTIRLEPLPAAERKIIHAALAGNRRIDTFSEGTEPKRYVVIAPKSK
ncbi:RNA-binding cell elongation regulator Jag/EloR [Bacillus badius]|uniref:RNA-binding protein KhpB n=1 Tax=Bacillus badius TaxID=1455 RepID=A0ABR5AVM0_BACBA|nr:RNA-binding cell elongation regulator Jag/EloR [Bacillus badius]KIL76809.1 RNA-binding protein Jag [Bacillus badius]KIL78258.1 RNA-binding protein Jag [Bacillus badius]KZN98278.1 protein jag [Bacillus badius]KZR57789.1 protein jag [Bacillus badius]MED0666760.1 RNA-binding cell elongation regulator Jag/EloR [Bacillus badius]